MPKKADDTKYTAEDAAAFTLEQVKGFIEAEIPGAFTKKTKARKSATKKAAPKKAAVKKKAAPKKKK
jgi:DNA topoisomerase-1